jgi:hypothetical protein
MLNSKKLNQITNLVIGLFIAFSITACEKNPQDLVVAESNNTSAKDSQSRVAAFPSGTHPKLTNSNSTWNASTGVFTITANVMAIMMLLVFTGVFLPSLPKLLSTIM